MITRTISLQWETAKRRGWDRTYWAIDLHSTLIRPNYRDDELPTTYYPDALETMRMLSDRPDVWLIVYTCSWPKEIEKYLINFKEDGINFDSVNDNPDVSNTGYGCYQKKPYFNVLLDDKAGFDAETGWAPIRDLIKTLPSLVT